MKNFHYIELKHRDKEWGLAVNCVGFERYTKGMEYPSKKHPPTHYYSPAMGRILDDFGIVYVTEGEGVFESKHCPLTKVKSGDIFMLFPGEWHNYYPNKDTGWSHMWICFNGENMNSRLEKRFLCLDNPISTIGVHDDIIAMYLKAINMAEQKPRNYQIMLAGIVNYLLGVIFTVKHDLKEKKILCIDKMEEIRMLMIENLETGLSVHDLTEMIGMSYSSLRQNFKKYFNESPGSYFQMLKIQRAIELIRTTKMTIKEIAMTLDFNSWNNFCTAFKQRTGKRPSDFR